ncbi:hypothetical protein [Pseudonocardia nigra]|uniref:hypothetical protein n=1 Tax=Pseudonocardia nigra TaxID=1921578 RepID=UPI001C5FF3B9|nr:hypothetical protein [Pseudonocardia nigra]
MADTTSTTAARTGAAPAARWLGWGLVSGFLAGVVFMALNSWFAGSMGNPALAPFKVVATLAQGPPPPQATVWVGMAIHSVLSALLGLVFAALVAPALMRNRSAGWLVWAGLIYGGLVYVVDFQILSRFVGQFSAFLAATNQPLELAVHLVFGAVLAALLLLAKPGLSAARNPSPVTQAGA